MFGDHAEMFPRSLTLSLQTGKILALDSVDSNLESVIAFLTCFPCTEKLYIEVRFKSAMYISYNSYVLSYNANTIYS